jgi:hypothetical protein
MRNDQLAAARKVQNRYPDVAFRAVPQGIEVRSVLVPITDNMSAEDVRKALMAEAANG